MSPPQLIPSPHRAEVIHKLTAICGRCPRDASFYRKLTDDLGNGTTDLVGGADKYQPICRSCFLNPHKPSTDSAFEELMSSQDDQAILEAAEDAETGALLSQAAAADLCTPPDHESDQGRDTTPPTA